MTDTLYITDLDGTLLHKDKRISQESVRIINDLIEQGALLSVASARSLIGIQMINLSDVHFDVPLVLMNGVLLYDLQKKCILDSCLLDEDTTGTILDICISGGKTPFLYRVTDGKMDISFTGFTSEGERIFYRDRVKVFPDSFRQVKQYPAGGAVYFSMQDRYEVLKPIHDKLKTILKVECVLYMDNYLKNNWYLEIFGTHAGKGNGTKRLQDKLGVKRVVAFGDNLNDLPMLQAADVACVVANGEEKVRKTADYIIPSNEEDGVAKFIRQDFYNYSIR